MIHTPDISCDNQDKPEQEQGFLIKRCGCRSIGLESRIKQEVDFVINGELPSTRAYCKGAVLG